MANHRKTRGYKTQRNVADFLFDNGWLHAEAIGAGEQGDDIKGVPFAIEVKARSDFQPLSWLKQIRKRSTGIRPLQMVVMRFNGQGDDASEYGCMMSFDQVVQLLKMSGYVSEEIDRCRKCGQWNIQGRTCTACKEK